MSKRDSTCAEKNASCEKLIVELWLVCYLECTSRRRAAGRKEKGDESSEN